MTAAEKRAKNTAAYCKFKSFSIKSFHGNSITKCLAGLGIVMLLIFLSVIQIKAFEKYW